MGDAANASLTSAHLGLATAEYELRSGAPHPSLPLGAGPRSEVGATVAHELNNLLTIILGHTEMALCQAGETGPLRKALEQISHAASVGTALTAQWLSRHGAPSRRLLPTDLNRVVRRVLDIFQPLVPPAIKVLILLEPVLWLVAADEVGLEQVMVNLLDNACGAMPAGGALTVTTRNVTIGKDGLRAVAGARPGHWACVTVADTGVGMDEPTLARIFEPFFTAKEAGTGLGLAIAKRIVAEHGGWIAATSEPGQGSNFTIFLPACGPAAQEFFDA